MSDRQSLTTNVRFQGRTYLEVGQINADVGIMRLAKEEIPKTKFTGLGLEFDHDGNHGHPSLCWVSGDLRLVKTLGWDNFVLDKVDDFGESVLCEWRELVFNLWWEA